MSIEHGRDFGGIEKPIGEPLSMGFENAMQQIRRDYTAQGQELKEPKITQHGTEIHPDLQGIVFNFWIAPDGNLCAVNFEDQRTQEQKQKSAWVANINGEAFRNYSEAKAWMRWKTQQYGN